MDHRRKILSRPKRRIGKEKGKKHATRRQTSEAANAIAQSEIFNRAKERRGTKEERGSEKEHKAHCKAR
jgi:hypothetical protein